MWEVDEAVGHFSDITNGDKITGQLWMNYLAGQVMEGFSGSISALQADLKDVRNQICKTIHSVYSSRDFNAPKYLTDFLKHLIELTPPLEVVTVNYDLIFDTIIPREKTTLAKYIKRGRKLDDSGNYAILDTDLWNTPTVRLDGEGTFTKLHGSIDWKMVDGEIQCSNAQDEGFDPDINVALYPGFKGRPTRFPFDMFYDYLSYVARGANVVIFIGYSFRDEEINHILLGQIKRGTQMFVIDKQTWPPATPQAIRDNASFIGSGFGSSAARECISSIKEEIKPRQT